MNEQKIISTLIASRESWERIDEFLEDRDFSPESILILGHIRDYYGTDETAKSIDLEVLLGRLSRAIPNPKHLELLTTVVKNLPQASPKNITKEVLEAKRHATGLKLAGALTGPGGRVKELLDLYTKLYEAKDLDQEKEKEVQGLDLPNLVKTSFDRKNLIQIAPKTLNERLDGGAKPGHHILVFAPTEMGKTLMSIHMVRGFLRQKLPVLYIGNEDPIADIMMRLGTNLSGMSKKEIEAEPEKAMEKCVASNVDLFSIVELAPGTFTRIGQLVKKYQPKVVILDQLRNIDVKSENRTQALERAATEARNLAKRNGILVVSVTQAGDSASGKRILARGDVDGSNVGIPGQCDVMVGIGATEEEENNGIRTISLPKNKLGGNHVHFTVNFDYTHSRVIDHAG